MLGTKHRGNATYFVDTVTYDYLFTPHVHQTIAGNWSGEFERRVHRYHQPRSYSTVQAVYLRLSENRATAMEDQVDPGVRIPTSTKWGAKPNDPDPPRRSS